MFRQKNKIKNQVVASLVLFQLVLSVALPGILYPQPAEASVGSAISGAWNNFWSGMKAGFAKKDDKGEEAKATPIQYTNPINLVPVRDETRLKQDQQTEKTIIKGFKAESARDTAQQLAEAKERFSWRSFGNITAVAIKSGLRYFLNTMAYEYATWLASGGEGQQPKFHTEGWGVYLEDLADQSLGAFLETLGDGWGGYNLCAPPDGLKLSVTLFLAETRRPPKPACTFKQALGNWQNFITQEGFMDRFRVNFETGKNDITASLSLLDYAYTWSAKKQLGQKEQRKEDDGLIAAMKDGIADFIKTPAAYTKAIIGHVPLLGESGQTNFTGDLIADAINMFVGTLAGQLFQRLIREGLAGGGSGSSLGRPSSSTFNDIQNNAASDIDLLTGQSGQALFGGRQAAQERFLSFFDADIITQGDYQILNQLAICSNPSAPGPDECVIDHKLRLAIDQNLTVKEAIAKGYLDADAPFGFTSQGFEPPYNEGYPYRSLLILRTYRIIPVTWEIAALEISRFGKRTYSLNDLIAAYNDKTSPFYGLIDQSWVLKTPKAYCRAEGFGPSIISSQIIDGFKLVNRSTYCADYQSCIQKDNQGNCIYGYCMEEKRVWDLQGTECPNYYASCQSYVDRGNTLTAYLQNSLDYNGCSADNVGCRWYCQDYNPVDNLWSCLDEGERTWQACAQVGGCPLTASCEVAVGEAFCTDELNKVDLRISAACNQSSKWFVPGTGSCSVDAACTIQQGGVLCTYGGCDNLTNLINNPGFESRPNQTGEITANWVTADADYFALATGASEQIFNGQNSIRFYNAGGSLNYATTSQSITLPVGDYTFSAFVYNRLNVGSVEVQVGGDILSVSGELGPVRKTSVNRNQWENLSSDFSVVESALTPGRGQVTISFVVSGPQVSGTVWFDDFRISESCLVDRVLLTLTGTVDKDQSKIHFDRDAQECSAEQDGCSRLLTAPEGVSYESGETNSYNLFLYPGFETDINDDWLSINPPNLRVEQERGQVHSGSSAMKVTQTTPDFAWFSSTVDTGRPLLRRAFIYSFWAKTNTDNPATIGADTSSYAGLIRHEQTAAEYTNSPSLINAPVNMSRSVTDGQSINSSWKQFAVPIVFEPYCQGGDNPDQYCVNDAQCRGGGKCILPNDYVCSNDTNLSCNPDLSIFDPDETCHNASATCDGSPDSKLEIDLLAVQDSNQSIFYDDVQIQEIDLSRANPKLLPGLTRQQCLRKEVRPFTVWVSGVCLELDLPTLLNRSVVNLQKPPDYLNCRGYTKERPSPYVFENVNEAQCQGETLVWRADSCQNGFCCHEVDPVQCNSYAMYCQADEVGCEAYQPLTGGPTVPGVAVAEDYCPAECVGYNAFKQSPTYFESVESLEFFIPQTARQCSAANAGCDEFTSLDELAAGGESRGYFRYLRQCTKPTDVNASCSNYYTWQGSNESGYQLRVYSLNASPDGSPVLAIDDDSRWLMEWGSRQDCDGPEDIAANPFCKEFFGIDGEVHYEILNNTISCSENCHPFRKTRLGESEADAQANCSASHGTWQDNSCIYDAIPNEGVACSAAAVGCREYRGNAGGNLFYAFNDNLEDGETTDWQFGTISSEALSVGGHSLVSVGPAPQPQRIETMRANLGENCSPDTTRTCDSSNPKDDNCYQPSSNRCIARHPVTLQTCAVEVGQQYCGVINDVIEVNKTYLLSFWAKSQSGNVNLNVKIVDDQDTAYEPIGRIRLSPEWDYYTFGPLIYKDIKPSARLSLAENYSCSNDHNNTCNPASFNPEPDCGVDNATCSADTEFYLDNIAFRQVQGYFYVAKDSWQTPVSCDTNPFVTPQKPSPQFMLGCQQYSDSQNQVHNLKSFDRLCRQAAVGCQTFVDTHNSLSPYKQEFFTADPMANVVVPADEVIHIVNRPEFSCGAQAVGCQRFGSPTIDQNGNVSSYSDIYLINNPNDYQSSLCGSNEVGCEEYKTGAGFSYFKDPGNKVCQYVASGEKPGWYRLGSTSTEPDCPADQSPLGIVHPSDGFAGLCPAEMSSCTEFIDPVSNIAKNLLFNSDLDQDVDDNYLPDGWNVSNSETGVNYLQQKVALKQNTPYVLSFTNIANDDPPMINDTDKLFIGVANCPGLSSFDNSLIPAGQGICVNSKGEVIPNFPVTQGSIFCSEDSDCVDALSANGVERCATDTFMIPPTAYRGDWGESGRSNLPNERQFSGRFATASGLASNNSCQVVVAETSESTGGVGRLKEWLMKEISVKEVGQYFQLADSVDRRDCNGVVDPDLGCVLLNDRSQVNYKIDESDNSYLKFDADTSGGGINANVPQASCAGSCDSNVILKVRPDRECGQWLDCRTKIKSFNEQGEQRDFCLELAACDSLDEKGNCNSFVLPERQLVNNFVLPDSSSLYNLTAKVGDAKRLANISGYARAGITLTNFTQPDSTISGYYPYNLMTEIGGVAIVPNGNFEDWSRDGYPIGWEGENPNKSWDITDFRVVFDYQSTLVSEGVAVLGQGSLKVNSDKLVRSEFIDVTKNTDYILSLDINTVNLQPETAQAVAEVYGFDPNSDQIESLLETLSSGARLNWQTKTVKFNSGEFSQLRIRLNNDVGASIAPLEGSTYFDNVSLLPALRIADRYLAQQDLWQPEYVSRSCRVFPQSDSLSCEYTDSEGTRQRGWSGYCLEKDPRNPEICLQWWPIDLAKGDNFAQYNAFPHREPMYYCAKMASTPLSISAGTTGIKQPGADQTSGPWTNPSNELFVFSGNRDLGQPNFIDIKLVSSTGGESYDFTGFRLSPENNWEIGWIASGATINTIDPKQDNINYSDYDRIESAQYCVSQETGDHLEFSTPIPPSGAIVRCDDNSNSGDETKGSTRLPERLFEQTTTYGFGPNGEILSAAHRAKLAATSQTYCSQGYNRGLQNGSKIIVYAKANFDADGTFINIEYGVCDHTAAAGTFEWDFQFSYAYCGELVQVVTAGGQNKAWLSRVSPGSTYKVNGLNYSYIQDYQPFGSVVAPFPVENPAEWDSKDDAQDNPAVTSDDTFYLGNQPIFVEAPDTSFEWPYQARAGSPYSCDAAGTGQTSGCYLPDRTKVTGDREAATVRLQKLFAKSYNVWVWPEGGIGITGGFRRICQEGTPLAGRECTDDSQCYPGAVSCLAPATCNTGCLYSDGSFTVSSCSDDSQCQRCDGVSCSAPPECSGAGCGLDQGTCRQACVDGASATNPAFCGSGSAPGGQVAGACKTESPQYEKVDRADPGDYESLFWDVPPTLCSLVNNSRSQDKACAVAPLVTNISVNGQADDNTAIFGSDTVTLSFNPVIDSNQLPISSYKVDWSDGKTAVVSGTPLRDKSNIDDPYVLSHSYDYYDILGRNAEGDDIYCNTGTEDLPDDLINLARNSCAVKPKIQVIDNWGWCNGSINPTTRQLANLCSGGSQNGKVCSSNAQCPDGVCGNSWGYQVNAEPAADGCLANPAAWTKLQWYIIIAPPQ